MSIVLTNGQDQKVDFGNIAAVQAMTQFTVMAWAKPQSPGQGNGGRFMDTFYPGASPTLDGWAFGINPGGGFQFQICFDGGGLSIGQWAAATVSIDSWRHYAVSYDSGSASNDPIFYKEGASQTLTTDTNPTGSVKAFTGPLLVGNRDYTGGSLDRDWDGELADFRIYSRILVAAQVKTISDMRGAVINDNGLIFHCPAVGASGLQKFDFGSLAGSNKLIDRINGAQGTPSGTFNIGGRGSTHLAIGG